MADKIKESGNMRNAGSKEILNNSFDEDKTNMDNEEEDTEVQLSMKLSKPLKPHYANLNASMKDKHDNGKTTRVKARRNRELDVVSENAVLNSRLRSSSGKVYSSSVSVEAGSAPNSPINSPQRATAASQELEEIDSRDLQKEAEEMCLNGECCRGTTKIISMISSLQNSIDGVLKKVSTQEIVSSNAAYRINDLQEKCDQQDEELDDISKDLVETKFKLEVVSNIVIKQDQQIAILNKKISDIQQREMSANVVVTGIIESKNEKPIELFNSFVQEKLEIQELIPAEKAFRIGNGSNRPLIVELRHPEQKRKLFANASKLKGKRNKNKAPFFLSDHLPEDKNEDRRRANELFAENRRKPSSHQLEMNFMKGRLIINDEPYRKAVSAPSARDLLEPDEKLFDKADELDIVKGSKDAKDLSRFYSYAVAVKDFEDVQAAFLKLRLKFADATHISCAYRLPGVNTPSNQDYVDDGEFGCGRTLLRVLKDEQFMNMAIFIVRYFGGQHLGMHRFTIFQNLARKAIKALIDKREQEKSQTPAVEFLPDDLRIPHPDSQEELEAWEGAEDGNWETVSKSK